MNHIFQIVGGDVLSLIGLVALIWLAVRMLKHTQDQGTLILKWAFTIPFIYICIVVAHKMGPFGPFLIVVMGIILSVMWTPHLAEFISNPIASLYDGGNFPPEPKPFYSIAFALRKREKPLEAIVEIRKQLAKFPNDYEGILLLATIQAEDTKDLASAEITLNKFCEREKAPAAQVAAAFTQLADWHLKLMHDSESARAALQRIIEKFPDTEFSTVAAGRIAHLGGAEKILLAAHDRRPVFVPEGIQNAGLRESIRELVPEEMAADKQVEELVKHLQQHPLDFEAREKLAILYARHFQRLDLAANQLMQLAAQPDQSPKHIAHWLNLLADLQIRGGLEFEAVAPTLEKIIELFPDLPVADLARKRLSYLRLEIHGQKEKSPNKTLGDYEQNIGLKGDRFYSPRQL